MSWKNPKGPTWRESREALCLEAVTRCNWIRARLLDDMAVYSPTDLAYFAGRLARWEGILASCRRLLNASSEVTLEVAVHGALLFSQPAEPAVYA